MPNIIRNSRKLYKSTNSELIKNDGFVKIEISKSINKDLSLQLLKMTDYLVLSINQYIKNKEG